MTKSQKLEMLGNLGEHGSKRLVKLFYQDMKLRKRTAWLCGVAIGVMLVWTELVMFYVMSH